MSSLICHLATAILLTITVSCIPAQTPLPMVDGMNCDLAPDNAPRIGGGDGGCPDSSCGNNSPVINAFRYGGLHPDGCKNAQRIGLVSPSLVGNYSVCNHGSEVPLYLDAAPVDSDAESFGYELVARDKNDNTICTGTQLVGVTFQISLKDGKKMTLRISQMGATPVAPTKGREPMKRTTYLITPDRQPANSLCSSLPPELAKNVSTPFLSSGYGADNRPSDLGGENFSAYAIVIPGALYDQNADVITRSVVSSRLSAVEIGRASCRERV